MCVRRSSQSQHSVSQWLSFVWLIASLPNCYLFYCAFQIVTVAWLYIFLWLLRDGIICSDYELLYIAIFVCKLNTIISIQWPLWILYEFICKNLIKYIQVFIHGERGAARVRGWLSPYDGIITIGRAPASKGEEMTEYHVSGGHGVPMMGLERST